MGEHPTEMIDMNDTASLTRRQFLHTTGRTATALAAASSFAPALLSAPSPSKTVGVGCIGLGTRGGDLINAVVHAPNVKVVAVCDVYEPHRPKGVERSRNPEVKAYVDYRELLADPRVDAVVIATPDHWYCQMVLDRVNCIQSRGTPKCSTDEAFVEKATFLMSLVSQQERRAVRWDSAREEIV